MPDLLNSTAVTGGGVFLDSGTLQTLSPELRQALMVVVFGARAPDISDAPASEATDNADPSTLTPLNLGQVTRFMSGVNPKTASLLRKVAEDAEGAPRWSTLMTTGDYDTW